MTQPKATVRVYQRRRDGQFVAAADTRELHAFAVVATERQADAISPFLNAAAATLAGEDMLVLSRAEYEAARAVLDAMGGEDG